jgi:hypothetical protein
MTTLINYICSSTSASLAQKGKEGVVNEWDYLDEFRRIKKR